MFHYKFNFFRKSKVSNVVSRRNKIEIVRVHCKSVTIQLMRPWTWYLHISHVLLPVCYLMLVHGNKNWKKLFDVVCITLKTVICKISIAFQTTSLTNKNKETDFYMSA